jgi:hypothetical protein
MGLTAARRVDDPILQMLKVDTKRLGELAGHFVAQMPAG